MSVLDFYKSAFSPEMMDSDLQTGILDLLSFEPPLSFELFHNIISPTPVFTIAHAHPIFKGISGRSLNLQKARKSDEEENSPHSSRERMSKDVLASFTGYKSSNGDLRPTFVTCTKVPLPHTILLFVKIEKWLETELAV